MIETQVRRTIIFDFDGTLCNTFEPIFNWLLTHEQEIGLNLTSAEFTNLRNLSIGGILRAVPGGWYKIPRALQLGKKWFYDNLDQAELFSGVEEMVIELTERGYNLMILTSNTLEAVEQILSQNGNLERYFDHIFESKGLFNKAKNLKRVLKSHRLNVNDALYVGDEIRDVQACKKIGLPIIAVSYGFNGKLGLETHGADLIVDHPSEIIAAAEKIFWGEEVISAVDEVIGEKID